MERKWQYKPGWNAKWRRTPISMMLTTVTKKRSGGGLPHRSEAGGIDSVVFADADRTGCKVRDGKAV
jgi:hypothetical protein